MILRVVLLTASILKILNPVPDGPIYVFFDPSCKWMRSGRITIKIDNLMPPEPTDPVGTITQGDHTCKMLELVYPGI